jgi:hypothetical protein
MSYHQYFPQEWIDLQIELSYHEKAILAVMSATDYVQANPFEHSLDFQDWETAFLVKLAAIAAYCGIVVDGTYDRRQIDRLCVLCTDWLRKNRKEWRVDHHE